MDPKVVAPVQALKERTPTTEGDLVQMLGILSYYQPFIPNFFYRTLNRKTQEDKEEPPTLLQP